MVQKYLPKAIKAFLETESASGMVMIAFAILALALANSPIHQQFNAIVEFPIKLGFANWTLTHTVSEWVKDVLMVFFFLVVALELKAEMTSGTLAQRDRIVLPLFAAIGGMAVPALIYILFNRDHPEFSDGWAIPCATDIAFALCVLMIVGKKVPQEVKIFLLAIAIFDDLGAIIIIATFFSENLQVLPLCFALLTILMLVFLNYRNVTSLIPYYLVGIVLWFCFYASGIHTTLAGVALGMSIPTVSKKNPELSPLEKHIQFLHPWVSYLVLPIFALTSAGVSLLGVSVKALFSSLPMGVACGLFFGKQIGILGTTFVLIKSRIVRPLEGVSWSQIYGVSVLAGIGFTMSLFISLLAFEDIHMQNLAKLGVIVGSLFSTVLGFIVFRFFNGHVLNGRQNGN